MMLTQYTNSIRIKDLPTSYTVVDIETTGLDPVTDSIIEISAIKVVDGQETDAFTTLVSCKGPIPRSASEVHGITKDMLVGAPTCPDAIAAFVSFADGDVLMGHNANRFDRLFIERVAAQTDSLSLQNDWVDTLTIARKLHPGERVDLASLCRHFGVRNEKAHRALSDCRATHQCYLELRNEALSITTEAAAFNPTDGAVTDHSLDGESVVFSGDCGWISRHDLMQIAVDHGGQVQDRTTLKTTLVVSINGEMTGKVRKALDYSDRTGARIIDLPSFFELAGEPTLLETSRQERSSLDKGMNGEGVSPVVLHVAKTRPASRARSSETALLLCICLGWIGAHRYYMRQYGMGVLYTFTFGLFCFGWFYDIYRLIKKQG